jgi:hypothetical protein
VCLDFFSRHNSKLYIVLTLDCSSLLLSVETPAVSAGSSSVAGGEEKVKKKKHRDSIAVHKHREEKQLLQEQQQLSAIEAADEGPSA